MEKEPISRVESGRSNLLRPPTKAELLAFGLIVVDAATLTGLVVYEKVTGQTTWPYLDILLGLNIVGASFAICEGGVEWMRNRFRSLPKLMLDT